MRINCPICGMRDRREFYTRGFAGAVTRPDPDAGEAAWDAYLHLRENPAGRVEELWYHAQGCGAWIIVERDTTTHEVYATRLAEEAGDAA